jgi:hypothetical protein
MGTRIVAYAAAALTAAGLIGWGVGQLASRSVAGAAQLTGPVSRSQLSTVQASASTSSKWGPCPAHSSPTRS